MVWILLTVFLIIIPQGGEAQDIINICNHVNRQNKTSLKVTGSSINVTAACSCLVTSDGVDVSVDSVLLSRLTIMASDGEFSIYNGSNGLRNFTSDNFIIIWNTISENKSSTFEMTLSANNSSHFDLLCLKTQDGKFPWSACSYSDNKDKMCGHPSTYSGEETRKESLDDGVVAGAFVGGLFLGLLLIAGAGMGYRYWRGRGTPSPVRSALKRLSLTKSGDKTKDYGRLGASIDHLGIDRANKSVPCRTTKNVTLYSPESPPVIQIQEKVTPKNQRRGKSTRNPNMPVEIRNLALYRNVSDENLVEEDITRHGEGSMVGSGKQEKCSRIHNGNLDVPDNASSSMGTEDEYIEQSTANAANLRTIELSGSRENKLQKDHSQEQEELTAEGVSPGEQGCEQKTNEMSDDKNHSLSERERMEAQENFGDGDLHFTYPLNISASEGLEEIPSQHDTNKNHIVVSASKSASCYDNKGLDDA